MFEPSLGRCYPMGAAKRRIVADVLPMSALKFRNPIQIFIQMKVNDFSQSPYYFCPDRFHGAQFSWREHDHYHMRNTSGVRRRGNRLWSSAIKAFTALSKPNPLLAKISDSGNHVLLSRHERAPEER